MKYSLVKFNTGEYGILAQPWYHRLFGIKKKFVDLHSSKYYEWTVFDEYFGDCKSGDCEKVLKILERLRAQFTILEDEKCL